jgi:hypothetical protein
MLLKSLPGSFKVVDIYRVVSAVSISTGGIIIGDVSFCPLGFVPPSAAMVLDHHEIYDILERLGKLSIDSSNMESRY